jgi:AcrR family transcriptional regulator
VSGKGAKDRLLEAAMELFYENGFHATGIDRIIETAGVTRMTLYKYFPSKDDLILAVMEMKSREVMQRTRARVEAVPGGSGDRILALFTVLQQITEEAGFCGCPFTNAVAEYSDHLHPVHAAAVKHTALARSYLVELCADAGAQDPALLADQLAILLKGAAVLKAVEESCEIVRAARRAAVELIRSQGIGVKDEQECPRGSNTAVVPA